MRTKIKEETKRICMLFEIKYTVVKGKERAFIRLKSLSHTINQKLKFGIVGKEEQYSFDQLKEVLSKSFFKKRRCTVSFCCQSRNWREAKFRNKCFKRLAIGFS